MGTTPILGTDVLDGHGNMAIDNDPYYTTIGAGWTISGGVATFNAGASASITKTLLLTTGKTYRVRYTVSSYVSGNYRAIGGATFIGDRSVDEIIIATGTSAQFQAMTAGNFVLDNWIVQELTYKKTSYKNLSPSNKISI